MPNPNRVVDGTDLSIDMAEERLLCHRDYLAHCLRWSYVCKTMLKGHRYKTDRVLDVGCGSDLPLPRLLHSNRMLCEYVGIDYNNADKFYDRNWGRMDVTTYGDTIFPRDIKMRKDDTYTVKGGEKHHKLPTIITSFEVAEHTLAKHAVNMIKGFHKIAVASGGAEVIMSTPCWDVKHTAANHLNEMKHGALGFVLEEAGFEIMHNFGTFGSISDYKDALFKKYGEGVKQFFEDCREYKDSNVLSNMFCSPFPELSRNSIWHLRPASPDYTRKFPHITELKTPWASSEDWENLNFNNV